MASSLCQVKVNAGSYAAVAGGIDVVPGDVVTVKLASSAGVNAGGWSISCVSTDETKTPAGINALLTIDSLNFEASFTVAAGTGQALIFESKVNGEDASATRLGIFVLVSGYRVGAVDETFEGNASFGWAAKVNAFIRAGGGGFSAPTGTGLMTVTGGSMDGAALALGTGVATWMTTPSSANLLAAITDETGTGSLVFGTTPTLRGTPRLNNPGNTFYYEFTPAAIAANRTLSLPLLTGNDTIVTEAHAAVLSEKTLASLRLSKTSSSATGDQNAFSVSGVSLLVFTGAANVNIRGLDGGVDGQILVIKNRCTAGALVNLVHQHASASAEDRYLDNTAADYAFGAGASAVLLYDAADPGDGGTAGRWTRIAAM